MSIRERQIQSTQLVEGATQTLDLPRDAVFHMIQLSIMGGSLLSTQGSMGTGGSFDSTFPFCLLRNIRLIRNGSDVVWQGSGRQLAKEHYYLNSSAPFGRIYTVSSNVETLRTATVRGVTVPANSDGICANGGGFTIPTAASSSATVYFDMQMELWLQMGPEDAYQGTLLDARPLATFQIEVTWETSSNIIIPGTAETITFPTPPTLNVLSIDQDNVAINQPYGTFKRSSQQYSNIPYSSSNFQIILPRGNFFQGIIMSTRAFKSTSTTVLQPENAVITEFVNRINTNFQLRAVTWRQLQAKNMSDYGGRAQPWSTASGMPQGWAFLYYPVAGDKVTELIPTYVMDTFDLLVNTAAIGASQNGVTTASTNPYIDLLLQEIIPGVSVSASAPRGAMAGSKRATTAKPYG